MVSGDIPIASVPQAVRRPGPVSLKGKNLKEYVGKISLWSRGSAQQEEICALLLYYYKLPKISKGEFGEYIFPDGQLERNKISFKYSPENWKLVDNIIEELAKRFYWTRVGYRINGRFNGEKLVNLCQDSKMGIEGYLPSEEFKITVSAEGWGREGNPAIVVFKNIEDNGSYLEITQFKGSKAELEDEFYDKLNPENIIMFLKSCLVDLIPKQYEKYKKLL